MEQDSIRFGDSVITYRVIRRPRRKTCCITHGHAEGVFVLCPDDAGVGDIRALVKQKAMWILKQQHDSRILSAPTARKYVSGESFLYLGRYYQLLVNPSRPVPSGPRVRLTQGKFIVDTPRFAIQQKRESYIRDALQEWYESKSADWLTRTVSTWSSRLGMEPNGILIRDQRKRWGSCDRLGNIRLNWRLIMAPVSLIEYVVVHELCHLKYPDHSNRFWIMLRAAMPDYEIRRNRLMVCGPKFNI